MNTFVLLVTAILISMRCDVVCCRSRRLQDYVCVVCQCNVIALRCDVDLLLVWTVAGIRFC